MARRNPASSSNTGRTARIIDLHQAALARLLQGVIDAIMAILRLLSNGAIQEDRAREMVTETLTQGQQSSARLAWSYLNQLNGTAVQGTPDAGVDDAVVQDLVDQVMRDQSVTSLPADVVTAVSDALTQSSSDAIGEHGAKNAAVTGYRRVPHPELSEGGVCGLCLIASTKLYTRGDLKKIHDGCKCTVTEVTATSDPGDALNNLELGDLYEAMGGTSGREAKKLRFQPVNGKLERVVGGDAKQRLPQNDPSIKKRTDAKQERLDKRIRNLEASIRRLEEKGATGSEAERLTKLRAQLNKLRRTSAA